MKDTFDNIIVGAFPASGKSETFKFIQCLDDEQRARLHLGAYESRDDYPLVASYFRIDAALEEAGKERIFSPPQTFDQGGFSGDEWWDVLDKFLGMEYKNLLRLEPDIHQHKSVLIECARGGAVGDPFPLRHGYFNTLRNLPESLLERSVFFYVSVYPETSRRKNDERYDPARPLSTLSHRVATQVMHDDYGIDDVQWMRDKAKAEGMDGYIRSPQGIWIPIGVLDNETEDLTSFVRDASLSEEQRQDARDKLYAALENILPPLFERYQAIRKG